MKPFEIFKKFWKFWKQLKILNRFWNFQKIFKIKYVCNSTFSSKICKRPLTSTSHNPRTLLRAAESENHGGHERDSSVWLSSFEGLLIVMIQALIIVRRTMLWSCSGSVLITRQWFKTFLITARNWFTNNGFDLRRMFFKCTAMRDCATHQKWLCANFHLRNQPRRTSSKKVKISTARG